MKPRPTSYTYLLPTGSNDRGVLGVGSIPVANIYKIVHYNCTIMT